MKTCHLPLSILTTKWRAKFLHSTMTESSFLVEAVVGPYHVYKEICNAAVGEELTCWRERFNAANLFAVTIVKGETTVCHIPRKISSICSLFLQRNGTTIFPWFLPAFELTLHGNARLRWKFTPSSNSSRMALQPHSLLVIRTIWTAQIACVTVCTHALYCTVCT